MPISAPELSVSETTLPRSSLLRNRRFVVPEPA
jgi:hypothetical protein